MIKYAQYQIAHERKLEMKLFKITLLTCLLFLTNFLWAEDHVEILPASAVFIPKVTHVNGSQITVNIDIKSGYYLYRTRLFSVTAPEDNILIKNISLSKGKDKTDEFFGTQSVWYGGEQSADIVIDYENPTHAQQTKLKLRYQGCRDGVICYPPSTVILETELPKENQKKPASNPKLSFGQKIEQKRLPLASEAIFLKRKSITSPFAPSNEDELLPEDDAFSLSLEPIDAATWSLKWTVANDYYLYKNKIDVVSADIAKVKLSQGQAHSDSFFGKQVIYRNQQGFATLYFKKATENFKLAVVFQGCADRGVCYPVMRRELTVSKGELTQIKPIATMPVISKPMTDNSEVQVGNRPLIEQMTSWLRQTFGFVFTGGKAVIEQLTKALQDNLFVGMGLLLIAGLALSFTPCVLPMLPILLGIITNQHQVSKTRAAVLSSAYALGVATMMAVFGLVVAKTGINIQIIFQQPLWLIIFAALFILMGLAMLGIFNVAMPNSVQNKVFMWQNKFKAATTSNLFIVGALSMLVVGPCIAPPLIAILAFIATTGDSLKGALYLFSLGLGMSLPLVIFATAVTTVPKTGAFSRLVTHLFALLLFGVGLWLLSRLLPGPLNLTLWGLFMLAVAWLFTFSGLTAKIAKILTRLIALVALLIGLIWFVGGMMGNSNPLNPLTKTAHLPFKNIDTIQELQTEINNSQKPVMLDIYADWCVSCQEIEHTTFTDKQIIETLEDFKLLKLDITEMTEAHQTFLNTFNLIGPPALLFFKAGKEIRDERNIGVIHVQELQKKLQSIL